MSQICIKIVLTVLLWLAIRWAGPFCWPCFLAFTLSFQSFSPSLSFRLFPYIISPMLSFIVAYIVVYARIFQVYACCYYAWIVSADDSVFDYYAVPICSIHLPSPRPALASSAPQFASSLIELRSILLSKLPLLIIIHIDSTATEEQAKPITTGKNPTTKPHTQSLLFRVHLWEHMLQARLAESGDRNKYERARSYTCT